MCKNTYKSRIHYVKAFKFKQDSFSSINEYIGKKISVFSAGNINSYSTALPRKIFNVKDRRGAIREIHEDDFIVLYKDGEVEILKEKDFDFYFDNIINISHNVRCPICHEKISANDTTHTCD